MTDTQGARFALDEGRAREWLASTSPVGPEWSPVHDDEGGTIAGLVMDAQSDGILIQPRGDGALLHEAAYDFAADDDGGGYRWLVYLPGGMTLASAFAGAPSYAGGLPLSADGGTTTVTGADAALEVLREAASSANSLLDDLDRYVASLPLAVRAPEVAELADVLDSFTAAEIRCLMQAAAEMAGAGHDHHDLSSRQIALSERAWRLFGGMA